MTHVAELPPGTRHGTPTARRNFKCECTPCKVATARYDKHYKADRVRGIARSADVSVIRDHVAKLRAAGMSFAAIAECAGYSSPDNLRCALRSERSQIKTVRRILAVTSDTDQRPFALIDGTGAQRRLRALAALGWPAKDIAAHAGLIRSTIVRLLGASDPRCHRSTAEAVTAAYDALWDIPGPSPWSRARARRSGWILPLAWDDDTIDDPNAGPAIAAKDTRPTTGRPRCVTLEDFLDTYDHHNGDVHIAAHRLGMEVAALERTLYLARRDGIDVRFHRGERTAA